MVPRNDRLAKRIAYVRIQLLLDTVRSAAGVSGEREGPTPASTGSGQTRPGCRHDPLRDRPLLSCTSSPTMFRSVRGIRSSPRTSSAPKHFPCFSRPYGTVNSPRI